MQEKLVPSLKAIKTKEPAVMMAALGVFRQIGTVADSAFLALEVLPILWSFSLGPLLDLHQFGEYMTLIKTISSKIEREQRKKLQELSSAEANGFRNGTAASWKGLSSIVPAETESTRDNFERLVLGRGVATSNDQENDIWLGLSSDTPVAQASTLQPSSAAFPLSSTTTGPTGRQSSLIARSITPDLKMNSFLSLEPTTKRMSSPAPAFPALQPSAPNPWSMPNTPSHQHVPSGMGGPGPSLASLSSMNSSNASLARTNLQTTPNYSAFSIPPPPSTQTPSAFANTGRSPSSGGSGQTSPFLSNGALQPQQGNQKQGLDKYQSLI
jgi:SCY1-like protein 2